jgi:methionyl-tRNA formyltransferase
MNIDAGLDTGPMLLRFETEIGPDETAPELYARLSEAGAPLVAETLRCLERGTITPLPQDNSQASFAPPLKREEGRIDWSLTAQQVYNRIRGLQPWPGAFSSFRGKNCAIWGRPLLMPSATVGLSGEILKANGNVVVSCVGRTALRLEFVQLEGRKRVTALEFANGARLAPGDRFGD